MQAQGKIVQCIGAVVDVEFPRNQMPKIYDALKMDGSALTLEVQQQLGDGVVRTIALGSSDGLRRGLMVSNTGNPITVPVGKATLGRIMDVLGAPIHLQPISAATGCVRMANFRRLQTNGLRAPKNCPAVGGPIGQIGCANMLASKLLHPSTMEKMPSSRSLKQRQAAT